MQNILMPGFDCYSESGVRDLTVIYRRVRENAKFLNGIRDLTANWEAGIEMSEFRDAMQCQDHPSRPC